MNKLNVDFELEPRIDDDMTYVLDGVEFTSPARVSGVITDNAGYMRLTLNVLVDYCGECARCLKKIKDTLSFTFERTVVSEDTREKETDDGEEDDYYDEYVVLDNGKLDVDGQLQEMLILEFPTKLLCSEECLGLCIKCGHDLNEGECGCDRGYHDSRWDILKGVTFAADVEENSEK